MISLHQYHVPKEGKETELEAIVKDKLLKAMSEQPGFISSARLKPYTAEQLEKMGATKPAHAYETITFWRSEEERATWAASDLHMGIISELLQTTASAGYTVQTVEWSHNL